MPIKNYVDSDGVFHQRVGRVDLSNLNWVNESYAPSHFYAQFTSIKNFTEIEKANIFCAKYTVVSASDASNQSLNKVIVSSNQYIAVDDNSYTDATTFKNAMQDVYLYYELATPITMTIDGNEAVTQIKNDLCKRVDYSTVDIFTAIKQYDETVTQEIPIQFVVQTQTIVYLVNGFKHGSYSSYLAHSYENGYIYHVRSYNGVWSYNQLAYMS